MAVTAADPPEPVDRVRAWFDNCGPSAPVRVGLLLNPNAGQARNIRLRQRLTAQMPGPHAWVETRDLGSLRRGLTHLVCEFGANVLAICGGDGTVHHVVNALLGLTREVHGGSGLPPAMPRLLLLNGGTLNIVGRTCAIHGPPDQTLSKFLRYFAGAPLSRVPTRRLELLAIQWHVQQAWTPVRYGFVFGSEVAYHAIELYERFGAGYGGLLRFLAELSRGALLGSELWRVEGWKVGPYSDPLRVDDRQFSRYTGVAASTVDLTLAIGAARAIRRQLFQPGFSARVVEELAPLAILSLVPAMMADRPVNGLVDFPTARQLDLAGPYTLDGELFHQPDAETKRVPLRVQLADVRLHGIPGQWTADEW